MASTSNFLNSSVGVVNHGGHIQTGNINMNVYNTHSKGNESEFDLPRLIDTFYGREEEFNTLEKLFFFENRNQIVVHGLPGYGKTELCKQFAQRCLDAKIMDRVFWIKAENKAELNKYSACLKTIYKDYKDQRCMFVFDNALNRRSISEYEPANNNKHKMLVTSHVKNFGYGVVPLSLYPLTSEPVTQIFKAIVEENYREEDLSLYLELGWTVDNVPLGVQIVAGHVRQGYERYGQSFQLKDCVEEMKQSKRQIMNDTFSTDNPNPYNNSIYGALTISINKIKEEEDIHRRHLAVIVLCVCAFLDPERIYCHDFKYIPTITELIGDKNSERELESAIRLLVNFSFVNYRDTDEDVLNIHRLVQSYLRHYLSSCDLEDKRCYSACVYYMWDEYSSVLRYADVSTEQECAAFLKKVFQDSNGSGAEIIYKYNLFHTAAEWNRIKVLELLVQHADINETNDNGHKVMYSVARTWNVEAVELLIERGVDVNHRDASNRTPIDSLLSYLVADRIYLSGKIQGKIMSTLTVLLARGALFDKDILSKQSEFQLLSSAVKMNKLDVLQSLIQKGLNVNSRGSTWGNENSSVLRVAVGAGNFECIQMLVSHGAYDNDSFYKAIEWNRIKEFEILVQHTDINKINDNGHQVMYSVARSWNVEAVELLIERGVDMNHRDANNRTPMDSLLSYLADNIIYLSSKIMPTLAVMLAHGALFDKNLLSEQSEFWLLSSAASMNTVVVLQSLIQNGFNVNSRGRTLWSANSSVLQEAVRAGNFECIQMLVSHGADVNAVDNCNQTALFEFVDYVIFYNRNIDKQELREILVLLNCKEHAQKTNTWGWSLLHGVAYGAHEELVTVLLETYNCEVNKQNYVGNTPLHELINGLNKDSNKTEVIQTVRTLTRCGASLDIKNNEQETPLNLLQLQSEKQGENFNDLGPLLTPGTTNTEPERNNLFNKCNIL